MGLGNITKEHTIWCGLCEEWETLSEASKVAFIRIMQADGWKKIAGRWICPECCKKHSKDQLTSKVRELESQ